MDRTYRSSRSRTTHIVTGSRKLPSRRSEARSSSSVRPMRSSSPGVQLDIGILLLVALGWASLSESLLFQEVLTPQRDPPTGAATGNRWLRPVHIPGGESGAADVSRQAAAQRVGVGPPALPRSRR